MGKDHVELVLRGYLDPGYERMRNREGGEVIYPPLCLPECPNHSGHFIQDYLGVLMEAGVRTKEKGNYTEKG